MGVFGPVPWRLWLRLVLTPRRLRHSQPVDKRLRKRNGDRIQNFAISSDPERGWIVFQTHTKPRQIAVAQDIRHGQLHELRKIAETDAGGTLLPLNDQEYKPCLSHCQYIT